MTYSESLADSIRAQFPSLSRQHDHGRPAVYLDGPAGSQVPESVIDAIATYYRTSNANVGGKFPTSLETGELMAAAHAAAADWFGSNDPRECIFGANMTTLTFAFSRALSKTWKPGDRIVLTELDHDGNVTPWRRAAADVGAIVDTVQVNPQDATLDVEDFQRKVRPGVKLVAFTCASNSVGSRTPVASLAEIAHQVGAEVYLDAVHLAPHGLLDVNQWKADYCVCSAYKFCGPHVGLLWGRLDRLEALDTYKLRPAPEKSPGKWMTGTQNFAAIAGTLAAIDHYANIGKQIAESMGRPIPQSRRENLRLAFHSIEAYEGDLARLLIDGLLAIPNVTVYGITDGKRVKERVPTVVCNIGRFNSAEAAQQLADRGIYCWHGDYYAVDICRALGQQPGGMIRLGLLHYNNASEVHQTLQAIESIAKA